MRTPHGDVRAEVVVRATEGYTADLPGYERDVIPMYSLMVATEPLSDTVWKSIELDDRSTFSDKRHLRIYGQRTADGRLAFGGRGAPYHFGSRVEPAFDHDARVHQMLRDILIELFPVIRDAAFTHAWGGNLGIPRDWYPSVGFDRAHRRRLGWWLRRRRRDDSLHGRTNPGRPDHADAVRPRDAALGGTPVHVDGSQSP